MRLVDWALLYAVVGVSCAVVLARREAAPGRGDLVLAGLLWPIYVPVLVAAPAPKVTATLDEHSRLVRAIGAIRDPAVVPLLPTRAHLDALAIRIASLDERVRALDDAIAGESRGANDARHGEVTRAGIVRLEELRLRASCERDDLSALIARLRVQITVLAFAGAPNAADVRELVAEIAARVEGVDAALVMLDPVQGRPSTTDDGAG